MRHSIIAITDFTQGILIGNLGIEVGEELLPSSKKLTIVVGIVNLDSFFKTISEYELEKLGKDGIVMHCSRSWYRMTGFDNS